MVKVDLFEDYKTLPKQIQKILEDYNEDSNSYEQCEELLSKLEVYGYSFEYGLDATPYGLYKISPCDIGDWAVIDEDVVIDENFKSNYGMVMLFSSDRTPNNTEKNWYAHLTLKNGQSAIVNAFEIKKLY